MSKFLLVTFICVSVLFSYTTAESLEDLKHSYLSLIMECAKEYPLPPPLIEQLKRKIMPDNDNAKCLFACAYKKAGMMDERGKMSVEGVHAISDKYLSDDPATMQKSREFTDACKSVNDVNVSDGDKGCERAALLFKCTVEKAPQFDFV